MSGTIWEPSSSDLESYSYLIEPCPEGSTGYYGEPIYDSEPNELKLTSGCTPIPGYMSNINIFASGGSPWDSSGTTLLTDSEPITGLPEPISCFDGTIINILSEPENLGVTPTFELNEGMEPFVHNGDCIVTNAEPNTSYIVYPTIQMNLVMK